jgi:DNA-binding response OmpR family regulator
MNPYPLRAMTSSDVGAVRVALIDDDTGLLTVLERRMEALDWERWVLPYTPDPGELAELRLQAVVVNPAVVVPGYLETIVERLPSLAVLMVSSPAPVAERVRALRAGADDWVTKPCHPEELIARIQAVLRRRRAAVTGAGAPALVAGELEIRADRFDAYAGDQAASLSRREFELLAELAVAEGRVLEREDIYSRVWGYTMARGDRSVDVFVRKVRQKLERISPEWRYVHTHFGVGYRFAATSIDDDGAAPGVVACDECFAAVD